MTDLVHAVFFVLLFGAIFSTVIVAEALYIRFVSNAGTYHYKETLANIITGLSYKLVDGIAIALFIQYLYSSVAQFGLQWYPKTSFISILLLLIFIDFCFYVNHVAMHKIRWFWASHVTHHSSEHMNFSTALRQNFTHAFNGAWIIWWLPAALIGFDKNWVLLAIEGNLIYQFFLHTEQVRRLGWLEKILNTPSHHRVHHGREPKQIDTNFGGIFIIWDKIFGTFRDEEEAGHLNYGVTRMPSKPYNPFYIQTYEWRSLWHDTIEKKDWLAPLRKPK